MKTKDWLDTVDDNANVTISALKLKAWAQQARLVASSLTLLYTVYDSEILCFYIVDMLTLVAQTASELEQFVLDVLRDLLNGEGLRK